MTSPPQTFTGTILSRHWEDRDGRLELSFWLKSDSGPLLIKMSGQRAVFFIALKNLAFASEVLNASSSLRASHWEAKALELQDFSHGQVAALYFTQQRAFYSARQVLRDHGLEIFEADIQPTERFLMERFITSTMQVEGLSHKHDNYVAFVNPRVRRCSQEVSQYTPPLRVLSLDIETSMDGKRLFSIASYCQSYDPKQAAKDLGSKVMDASIATIFMLGDPEKDQAEYTQFFITEKSLLRAFLLWFKDYDPDLIIGWSVINFDLRFLQRKADSLQIPLLMGRDQQAMDWRKGRDDAEYFTLTVPGRAVLDGIETLKSASYNFESFSLENVSRSLLKRGKLIHQVDNRGHEIMRLFAQDKPALAKYNLEDCRLVWEIFQHAQLVDFVLARARLTGLALDRFGGSVAAFDNRYLPLLHRQGFVAPQLKDDPEGVGSPGGYVMDSLPGLYRHVLVLDFKSLYPSIIRSFNIDPLALIKGLKKSKSEAVPVNEETPVDDHDQLVPGFNGAVFDRHTRILPRLIEELWVSRDHAKAKGNAAMSQAIKILMNSFYGVMGTPGCRFFDARLPSSITLRGHQILNETRRFIESQGYQVIYGDTDSLFVWLEVLPDDIEASKVFTLGQRLTDDLNAWWKQQLTLRYKIDSALDLEFETYFSHFFMPTIRGSEAGSKKRYAGRKVSRQAGQKDEIIFKGLEAVRTDWTKLAREFQRELYRRIFYQESFKDYVREIAVGVYAGRFDEDLVYRKRLRRELDDYQRNVPPHVQAARGAEAMRREQGSPRYYRRGAWVEYMFTLHGPLTVEMVRAEKAPLDYERYVSRQIAPIVDSVAQFLDTSFEEIAGQQLGLF